jgi:hypothetical protein
VIQEQIDSGVYVYPSFSASRKDNVRKVAETLEGTRLESEIPEFKHLVQVLEKEWQAGNLNEHPITAAAEQVGCTVHWVK